MPLRKSTQSANRMPAISALDASSPVAVFAEHTIVAGAFALNDVVEMIPWPAGTIPFALKVHSADLDANGAPTLTMDIGVMTGLWGAALNDDLVTARTCGAEFAAASTIGQAGGALDVAANLLLGLAPVNYDRSIGIKVAAAAATLTAGAKIRMAATFVPSPVGVAIG